MRVAGWREIVAALHPDAGDLFDDAAVGEGVDPSQQLCNHATAIRASRATGDFNPTLRCYYEVRCYNAAQD